jgi:hypothetical protein
MISTAGKKERKLIRRNVSIKGLLISEKSIACAGDGAAKIINRRKPALMSNFA